MLLPVAAFATDKMLTNAISNAQEKSILKVDLFLKKKKKNLEKIEYAFRLHGTHSDMVLLKYTR